MTRLHLHIEERSGCSVLHLYGELDMTTEDVFVNACASLLRQNQTKIIIDASGLGFCDCAALGGMIKWQREAEQRGGFLRLVGVQGPLARLLTVAELIDTFPPYADLQQACG